MFKSYHTINKLLISSSKILGSSLTDEKYVMDTHTMIMVTKKSYHTLS